MDIDYKDIAEKGHRLFVIEKTVLNEYGYFEKDDCDTDCLFIGTFEDVAFEVDYRNALIEDFIFEKKKENLKNKESLLKELEETKNKLLHVEEKFKNKIIEDIEYKIRFYDPEKENCQCFSMTDEFL